MDNDIIILRSVYGKVGQIYFIQPCPNPKTGRLPQCVKPVKGQDGNTEMILSEADIAAMSSGEKHFVPADHVFEIVDGTKFDLTDTVDAANWEAIKYCNWIAKDRYEKDANGDYVIDGGAKKYGTADLYVERPGEMTKVRVNKKMLVHKACAYIYEDPNRERIKKCKVLGRDLHNAIEADIIDYLVDIAEKNPKKIIDLYEGEDWKMQLFVLDAVDRGVIRKSDGIFKYDDKMLGGSMEATIITLRDVRYKQLLASIKRETYPEFLDQRSIDAIKEGETSGIPHYEKPEDTPQPTKTAKDKAGKLRP